jgi:pimeloyl-ACP methyl ester carboxylesterase
MPMKRIYGCLILLSLSMSGGCARNPNEYPILPRDAKAETYAVESRPFVIGVDTFQAEYGTITVPENRSKKTSRLIHLPFLRIHSPSSRPIEPVFGLAGGPGSSNMYWDWTKARTLLPEHDFILVGYRGVDGSVRLDCPEVTEVVRKNDSPLSDETIEQLGHAFTSAAQRLQGSGIDLDGYTMLETIEDNESVCRALGYSRINLLGESYGTRIAYLYALKYPERIFRSGLIAVNPPGGFVWEPETIDTQLRQYAALWSRDSLMRSRCADLYGAMQTVLTAMPQRWLFFPIDADKVKIATFGLLFQRSTAAMVFDAYVAAASGDYSGLALMSLAYDYIIPSLSTWGEPASKAVSADFDSSRNYLRDMKPPGLPLGSPMSAFMWGPLQYTRWPTHALPEEFRRTRRSDVQTLLLSGSVDFSTPAVLATHKLLPYLPNGKQIIFSECGHVNDMWQINPDNIRLILTTFYRTGIADVSKNRYVPMDFTVGWGFPKIAKVALAGALCLLFALVGLAVYLVRRHRRRSTLLPRPGKSI